MSVFDRLLKKTGYNIIYSISTKLGTMNEKLICQRVDKQFLMGIAITFVWLYHLRCTCHHLGDPLFKPLFIGVDIFLFLSAYGLCFSYNKNTLGQFYKNRIKRVARFCY